MTTLLTAAATHGPTVLAVDPAKVKPGWLALVIILLLGLAIYVLWRSMNRQLKKVDFDDGVDRSKAGRTLPVRNGAPRDGSAPSTSGSGGATPGGATQGGATQGGATPGEGSVPDGDGGASRL